MILGSNEKVLGWTGNPDNRKQILTVLHRIAFVGLLLVAMTYWIWTGTSQRSLTGDEIISMMAAQGIVEHGYPLMPSGYTYSRGYLTNYLGAVSILLLELNRFSIMLPSLVFAIGSLVLVYILARDVLGRPWIGLAVIGLLISLQIETFYASGPRMYMALQFLTLLATLSAWKGYIKGETKFQWLTVLIIMLAFFEHAQGAVLLAAIPLAVILVRWLRGSSPPKINYILALGQLVLLSSVVFYFQFVGVPWGLPAIAGMGAGLAQDGIWPNLDPGLWIRHIKVLEYVVPFGLMLVPLSTVVGLKAFRERCREWNQGFLYLAVIFGVVALAISMILNEPRHRFWVMIIPVYSLLLFYSVAVAFDWRSFGRIGWLWCRLGSRTLVGASLACGVILLITLSVVISGPSRYAELLAQAYGQPCLVGNCTKGLEESYSKLRVIFQPDDVVVSSSPWLTYYYIGWIDGWLRQKPLQGGAFGQYDSLTDEYFGVVLVDSAHELGQLRDSEQRVWLITDDKIRFNLSAQSLNMLEEQFIRFDVGEHLTVYTNSPYPRLPIK